MIGLIQKSGYIKPGGGGGSYARYIATRDGVELIEAPAGEGYLAYIAEHPRSHGLFSAKGVADLEQSMAEGSLLSAGARRGYRIYDPSRLGDEVQPV